jgi:hypothetical protein
MEGRLKADLRYAGKDRLTITRTADLRALLLDHQKRGRALERIFDLGSDGEHSGDRHARCREIARATLKGKSHD